MDEPLLQIPQTPGGGNPKRSLAQRIRALLDSYPGSVALGEISSEDSLATMAEYTAGNKRLHMGYSFELLTNDCSASYIRQTVETLESRMTDGWPCWAISNHDVTRVASRWLDHNMESGEPCDNKAKLFTTLLCALRRARFTRSRGKV